MYYRDAREFFEAAREASRDAERIRRQLDAMAERAEALGGGGFEPRVRSTGEPDRMGSRVAAMVDREAMLVERQADDYALIDAACRVLYGDGSDSGLWALVGWRADALALHYLDDMTWAEVAAKLCYSESHVQHEAQVALDVADGWGMARVVDGTGGATT